MNIIHVRCVEQPHEWRCQSGRVDTALALDLYRRLGSWPKVAEIIRGPHGERYTAAKLRGQVYPGYSKARWPGMLMRFMKLALEMAEQERKYDPPIASDDDRRHAARQRGPADRDILRPRAKPGVSAMAG